jgi:hypothetical protein
LQVPGHSSIADASWRCHNVDGLHAMLGYIFLTAMVRVLIRRPGAQMTQFEFVLVFVMGGVIILFTVGQDHHSRIAPARCSQLTP